MEQLTEIKTAKILLKRGVEIVLPAPFFLRLLGKKQTKIILKTPNLETQIAIAEEFLKTGAFLSNEESTMKEAIELIAKQGVNASKIVAMAMLNRPKIDWRTKRLAKRLRKSIDAENISYLFSLIVAFSGVQDFMNTIRLIQATRITKPMNLSQVEKTS